MKFRLIKYYMDAVDEKGDALLFYHVWAKFGCLPLSYSHSLIKNKGLVKNRGRLFGAAPEISENSMNFSPLRGKNALWNFDRTASFSSVLSDSKNFKIKWTCVAPNAKCVSNILPETEGYLEKLEIEMDGFSFPFSDLRWGRFIGGDHSLVWMRWARGIEKTLVFLNGVEQKAAHVLDGEIYGKNFKLTLFNHADLREGKIGQTILKSPMLKSLIPSKILKINEDKKVSQGLLRVGKNKFEGWAIDEKVCL